MLWTPFSNKGYLSQHWEWIRNGTEGFLHDEIILLRTKYNDRLVKPPLKVLLGD